MAHTTVPGLSEDSASKISSLLQKRLTSLLDLQLTLKHIHWNVVGPNFIAVHEMLDDQVGPIREMSDDVAERIAILGGEPTGTPAFVVGDRDWEDYPIGRGSAEEHLRALDAVFDGIIRDHREVASELGALDAVSEDILVGQLAKLELYQWFVRSHVDNSGSGS